MLIAGALGGIINYCMNAANPAAGQQPNFWKSLIIGVGATILVPLFLQITQSRLLDGIRNSYDLTVHSQATERETQRKSDMKKSGQALDTSATVNLKSSKKNDLQRSETSKEEVPPLKDYLVFAAYCLLASAAGPRFINSLMDGVIKDKKISQLKKENHEVTQEKNKFEQAQALETARNKALADHDEKAAMSNIEMGDVVAAVIKPQIGPKTVPDDPQKGRFGGNREVNERKLYATVTPIFSTLLFRVVIWVESTNAKNPLKGDVIFYLHDTFRPSVITLPEKEFTDGKAKLEPKTAWGAFTVGIVADGGLTLLEYDLAMDDQFDKNFRSR
jgi:hypothetical protein